MFKKFCAGVFVSGSVLSSVVGSSTVVAVKPGMSMEEIYERLGQVEGFEVANNSDLRKNITPEQIEYLKVLDEDKAHWLVNRPGLLKKINSTQVQYLNELDKTKARVLMSNPDVLEKITSKGFESLKKLNKPNALTIVQNRPEMLESMSGQQIGYLNGLDHNVAYSLICNQRVLSKINDEQVAHLKKLGDNWEAASKYIKSLGSGNVFVKAWNWLFG